MASISICLRMPLPLISENVNCPPFTSTCRSFNVFRLDPDFSSKPCNRSDEIGSARPEMRETPCLVCLAYAVSDLVLDRLPHHDIKRTTQPEHILLAALRVHTPLCKHKQSVRRSILRRIVLRIHPKQVAECL